MHTKDLMTYRPAADTSEAIEAALTRIADASVELEAEIITRKEQRGTLIMSGSELSIEENERSIRSLTDSHEQLGSLAEALAPQLEDVRRREKVRDLRTRLEELNANKLAVEFGEKWRTTYGPAAAAIAELCQLEEQCAAAYQRSKYIADELATLGEPAYEFRSPLVEALGGALSYGDLRSMIRLPGRLGAPRVPVVTEAIPRTRTIDRVLYNDRGDPLQDERGRPRTEPTEQTYSQERVRAVREDHVYWWPAEPLTPFSLAGFAHLSGRTPKAA